MAKVAQIAVNSKPPRRSVEGASHAPYLWLLDCIRSSHLASDVTKCSRLKEEAQLLGAAEGQSVMWRSARPNVSLSSGPIRAYYDPLHMRGASCTLLLAFRRRCWEYVRISILILYFVMAFVFLMIAIVSCDHNLLAQSTSSFHLCLSILSLNHFYFPPHHVLLVRDFWSHGLRHYRGRSYVVVRVARLSLDRKGFMLGSLLNLVWTIINT
jgi:hypothetical protein